MSSKSEQGSRFTCRSCGSCCSKIRGRLSEEEESFLKEYGYGKMPLINIIPVEGISFPLWDWEAKRFKIWQKERDIDARIRPSRAVFDLDSNKTIIVTYHMDSDSCPFLSEDGKCRIYDKKRAYICRLFPFQTTPFLETGEQAEYFGTCPALEDIVPNIPKEKKGQVRFLQETFGSTFLDAVQNDIITEWVNKTVIDSWKKHGKIRPAIGYPYDKLMKRIEMSEKIDFTDFLVESRIYPKEEIIKFIKRFDNCDDAREKIKAFLG